ncbi:MAG TPA: response regulator transcription factor [Bacteroidales bacterium]|nr:response regulator transcription factor [Bacteroidales bacterium]
MKNLNLIIVDDHTLFRNGLRALLENHYENINIREAGSGEQFLELLQQTVPDLVLMDISMPGMDGAEATRLALAEHPQLKIVALSMFGDEAYYYKMIDAGVQGFVLKDSEIAQVREAIETVMDGDTYFSHELLLKVIRKMPYTSPTEATAEIQLSGREMEVLQLICDGLSNQDIAEKLFISKRTVDKHRSNILSKTNSRNTAQLVMTAIRMGWVREVKP